MRKIVSMSFEWTSCLLRVFIKNNNALMIMNKLCKRTMYYNEKIITRKIESMSFEWINCLLRVFIKNNNAVMVFN